MKNYQSEKLEKELDEKTRVMEEVSLKLAKAQALLVHLIETYNYYEEPNPRAAVKQLEGICDSDHSKQSVTWYWDYKFIYKLVDITGDYIDDSKDMLEKVLDM